MSSPDISPRYNNNLIMVETAHGITERGREHNIYGSKSSTGSEQHRGRHTAVCWVRGGFAIHTLNKGDNRLPNTHSATKHLVITTERRTARAAFGRRRQSIGFHPVTNRTLVCAGCGEYNLRSLIGPIRCTIKFLLSIPLLYQHCRICLHGFA